MYMCESASLPPLSPPLLDSFPLTPSFSPSSLPLLPLSAHPSCQLGQGQFARRTDANFEIRGLSEKLRRQFQESQLPRYHVCVCIRVCMRVSVCVRLGTSVPVSVSVYLLTFFPFYHLFPTNYLLNPCSLLAFHSPFTPPPPPLPSPLLSSLYTSASRRLPLQANWRQFRNCQKKIEKNKKNAGKLETISQQPSIVQGGSRVGSPLSGSRSLSRQKSLSLSLEGSSSKSGPSSRENSKQSLGSPPRPLLSKVIYQ